MPKVTHHQEDRLRRTIRDATALDPLISLRSLQDVIEKKLNRSISFDYLIKLRKKVTGEVRVRADQEKVDNKIAQLRENNRIIREALLKIAYPSDGLPAKDSDRIRALEVIAKIEHSQAKLEMDFGLFTRHLGEIDVGLRVKPVSDATRDNMIKAFENWGMAQPQMRRIDPPAVIETKKEEIPHEQPKQQPAKPGRAIPVTGPGLVATE